jgi:hypothetical protein
VSGEGRMREKKKEKRRKKKDRPFRGGAVGSE